MIVCSSLREGLNSLHLPLKTYKIGLTTSIELTNFVGLASHRDRTNRSITIKQPHFVGKRIDLYSVPPSSEKYPMAKDYFIFLKTSIYRTGHSVTGLPGCVMCVRVMSEVRRTEE